jgi:serine phosphatase RsbU (regulator of sigma subunit)
LSDSTVIPIILRLDVVEGPALESMVLPPETASVFGRSTKCSLRTPENELGVSREHCRFQRLGSMTTIADLESRHGTMLNNQRLTPHVDTPLKVGDEIRVGPWVLRVAAGAASLSTFAMRDPVGSDSSMVTIAEVNRDGIHRRRLELLLECAKQMQAVRSEDELAQSIVRTLEEATGFSVIAFIRPDLLAEEIHVLGVRSTGHRTDTLVFSRSLIRAAAARGQAVKINRAAESFAHTQSLVGVQMCLCVPIMDAGAMTHCLYLDCREGHMRIQDDAAAFCQAVADLCSLTLSALRRADSEMHRARMSEQMATAALIQQSILPPTRGRVLHAAYRMHVEPGRFIAGDLFDIFALDHRRLALFMGDVSGKGVPAAMLAAVTSSYLTAALHNTGDLSLAVCGLNRHLGAKMPENGFVSLFSAMIDTQTGQMTYIDAGHGYWLIREPSGRLVNPGEGVRGLPLRVNPDEPYESGTHQLDAGSRLIVFSDGVIEQRHTNGEEFGMERILSALSLCMAPEDDVGQLLRAVRRHALGDAPDGLSDSPVDLADDLTIASIALDELATQA